LLLSFQFADARVVRKMNSFCLSIHDIAEDRHRRNTGPSWIADEGGSKAERGEVSMACVTTAGVRSLPRVMQAYLVATSFE
jgi:hypothetical protein